MNTDEIYEELVNLGWTPPEKKPVVYCTQETCQWIIDTMAHDIRLWLGIYG